MRVFDQIDRKDIDRREFHLWLLTTGVLVVLVLGIAFLMYPAVFPRSITIRGSALRVLFFGFCGLGTLLIGYLIDRQAMIVQLRKTIAREEGRFAEYQNQASRDFLNSLPGFNQFQDRLAMEYRRAANSMTPLSILVIQLKVEKNSSSSLETPSMEALGDGAKAVARKLRAGDSLFYFCSSFFGVILQQLNLQEGTEFARRIEEGLQDAAGFSRRFSARVTAFNYPIQVSTAQELLQHVRSLLPAELTGEPAVDADLFFANR